MRTFVIVTPGQAVGKPGATVTAEQLNMTDVLLDQYVDAGHAVEIHRAPPPRTSAASRSEG